jgi:hypothetical protein
LPYLNEEHVLRSRIVTREIIYCSELRISEFCCNQLLLCFYCLRLNEERCL